jgi:SAM-dependent methyltransferase
MSDPRWSTPESVAGFVASPPNETLLRFAAARRPPDGRGVLLDVGCGAGRNAVPLARAGWRVLGTDLSWPMLTAAAQRIPGEAPSARALFARAPMEALPIVDRSADFVVAHGIWNLAESSAQFRSAVAEAARVAKPGAALFVFTFSRRTLPPAAQPVAGEAFVFTEFANRPQIFLTADQLLDELDRAGFDPDPAVPLTEHNRPTGLIRPTGPVIYEAAFRRR